MGVRRRCPRVGDGPGVRGAAKRASVPALPGLGARAGAQCQQRRRASGMPGLREPVATGRGAVAGATGPETAAAVGHSERAHCVGGQWQPLRVLRQAALAL